MPRLQSPLELDLDGYTLIEASAGTGKTFTITSIYLRLVMERGVPPEEILVVTFTKAATQELRDKIRDRMADAVSLLATPVRNSHFDRVLVELVEAAVSRSSGNREEVLRRLRHAMLGMDQAAIYTIHGFCQRVLNEFPLEAGVEMGRRHLIFDHELFLPAVMEFVRSRLFTRPSDLGEAVLSVFGADDLPGAILAKTQLLLRRPSPQVVCEIPLDCLRDELRRFQELQAEGREILRSDALSVLQSGFWDLLDRFMDALSGSPMDSKMADAVGDRARRELRAWIDAAGRALGSLAEKVVPDLQAFEEAAGLWLSMREGPDSRAAMARIAAVIRKVVKRSTRNRRNNSSVSLVDGQYSILVQVLDRWVEDGGKVSSWMCRDVARLGSWLERIVRHCGLGDRVVSALATAVRDFAFEFMRAEKQRLGVVSFDDMLMDFRDALKRPRQGEGLARILAGRYRVALIDEFQDTDRAQWEIFRAIYPHPERSPLFLIGDPKQAIYGFRGADIFTYLDAKKMVPADSRFQLETNWRSAPGLVDVVNRVFSACGEKTFIIEGVEFTEVQARPENAWRLRCAVPGSRDSDDGWSVPVEFWLPPAGSDKEKVPFSSCRAVAAKVAEIVRLGAAGRLEFVGPVGETKPVVAGDVAILVRSHSDAGKIMDALMEHGIRAVYQGPNSVFSSYEARELLYILNAVLNPGDMTAVRIALGTASLGYSASDIAALEEDEEGMAEVVDRFVELNRVLREEGFYVAFRRLLLAFGIPRRLLALRDGARRLTNLRQLAELMAGVEQELAGPERLLTWLRRNMDEPGSDLEERRLRLETDEHLVQVMTYHVSKGLEFPIVFLPFAERLGACIGDTRNKDGLFCCYSTEAREYVCPVSAPPPTVNGKEAFPGARLLDRDWNLEYRRQRAAEEIRLAYVAMTRAKYKMFVVFDKSASASGSHLWGPIMEKAAGEMGLEDAVSYPGLEESSGPGVRGNTLTWERLVAMQEEALTVGGETGSSGGSGKKGSGKKGAGCPGEELMFAQSLDRLLAGTDYRIAGIEELRELEDAEPSGWVEPSGWDQVEPIVLPPELGRGPLAIRQWSRTSFTGMTAGVAAEAHALEVRSALEALPARSTRDVFGFPRGTAAGNCIHRFLELMDFGTTSSELEELAGRLLEEAGIDGEWRDVLVELGRRVVAVELLPKSGLRLRDLDRRWVVKEMEFHWPFGPALREDVPGVATDRGVIRGFIDLLFRHDGRFYVLDYKSNWLGDSAGAYNRRAMEMAMEGHQYWLQAAIYAGAVDSYLERFFPGYGRDNHFGGVFYLFVRGLELDNDSGNGILHLAWDELCRRCPWLSRPFRARESG